MLVSAWNAGELNKMVLEPCHVLFQFYVAEERLSSQLYQHGVDMFLGVSFNIASHSLPIHMFAQQVDLEVDDFIWTGGDCHVYLNHVEQVTKQPSHESSPFPGLSLKRVSSTFSYDFDDVLVESYGHHSAIKAPVTV